MLSLEIKTSGRMPALDKAAKEKNIRKMKSAFFIRRTWA